jgi:hypothetical protein
MENKGLSHVYWIGGSPCSGKSSIARILTERYGMATYNCDVAYFRHQKQLDPNRHPTFFKLSLLNWNELWGRPIAVQIQEEILLYHEQFGLILEDLLAMPTTTPILAEGAALLPDLVLPLLPAIYQAIWILPTESFQRQMYPNRGQWVHDILTQCVNPEVAFQNWMDRDVGFGQWVLDRCSAKGLPYLQVNGRLSIAENAEIVRQQFALE